jgi:hypothetical protein
MKNEDVIKWANRYGLDKFPSELRAMINDAYELVKQEDDICTTPPAQPAAWVGLTDEDIETAYKAASKSINHCAPSYVDITHAVEAKLREKNGY